MDTKIDEEENKQHIIYVYYTYDRRYNGNVLPCHAKCIALNTAYMHTCTCVSVFVCVEA